MKLQKNKNTKFTNFFNLLLNLCIRCVKMLVKNKTFFKQKTCRCLYTYIYDNVIIFILKQVDDTKLCLMKYCYTFFYDVRFTQMKMTCIVTTESLRVNMFL